MSFAFHSQKPKNFGRKTGSFYDSIPSNLFQVIHKPSNDEILKQLKASTKNDKTAEWRMRAKHEEGCVREREFNDLRKDGILFGSHSSRSGYSTSNYQSSDRGKGNRSNGVPYYDYGPICGTSSVLDDKKNDSIIREHCRRRGRLYGPQAITAVCGYPTTKSIIRGRAPSPPLPKATTYYNDLDDTFSHASSTNSSFKHTHYNTVAKSSRSPDSNRMSRDLGKLFSNTEPKSSGPLKNQQEPQSSGPLRIQQNNQGLPGRNKVSVQHARSSDQTNQKYSTPRNNVQGSQSDNISHKYDSSKVSARSERGKQKVNTKSAKNVTKFQLKNLDKQILKLEAPLLGGGDTGDPDVSKSSKRGKMRMPKKFKNQSSSGKKPLSLRRKQNVIKRKPLYVTNALDDKRHKGPKIKGITSTSTIDSIESQTLESTLPIKTIRTAVLPFPQAKYKRIMHD